MGWGTRPLRAGGILLVLLLVPAAGATSGRHSLAGGALRAQSDAALTRELAERLLTFDHRLPVRLYPGELAPEISFPLPLPADSRLLGSQVQPHPTLVSDPRPGDGPQGPFSPRVEVVVDTALAPAAAIDFYEDSLIALGWSLVAGGRRAGSTIPTLATSSLCAADGLPRIDIRATPMFSGLTDLRLRVDFTPQGPCVRGEPPTRPPPPPLPRLTPDQAAQARQIALEDARVRQVLGDGPPTVERVEEWHARLAARLLGATVVIALPEPLTLKLDWPAIAYDETETLDPPYEEFVAGYTARGFTFLLVHIDLQQGRVVAITPYKPQRH